MNASLLAAVVYAILALLAALLGGRWGLPLIALLTLLILCGRWAGFVHT